jgi:O-methyltransferase
MIKKIIKKILNVFGLSIFFIKKHEIVPKNFFIPFYKNNENKFVKLYEEGLQKVGGVWSDNFSKKLRYYSTFQMVEHVLKKDLNFDFVECGTWHGHTAWVFSQLIKKSGQKINFHIFDSFEGGYSALSKEDKNLLRTLSQSEIKKQKEAFYSEESFVKNIVSEFSFVKFYKGWIPTRFHEVKDKKFQFIHIDVDLYQPTYDSLDFFFPRLVEGGIILCESYNMSELPGANKAFEEFLKDKKVNLFYETPYGGCILIK